MASHDRPAPGPRPGRAARQQLGTGSWRASWRQWRRARPFWGGLLLGLGGVELIAIPLSGVLGHGAVRLVIYIGIGGVFGVLIGALMITCGVLICVNASHRVFYGITGVVLGILSFPASNLGGFFIGMLLAIVGGSIAFAWTPLGPGPPSAPAVITGDPDTAGEPGDTADDDDDEAPGDFNDFRHFEKFEQPDEPEDPDESERTDEFDTPGDVEERGIPERTSEAPGRRMLAVAALPLVLVAGLLGSPGARTATAAPQQGSGDCILGIICLPSPNPSPTPTASPSPSPTGLLPSVGTGASPGSGQGGKKGKSRQHNPRRTSGPGLEAATATSVITAGSATMDGLVYQGEATVPTAGGGSVKMMKFTATSLALSGDVTATVTQRGSTAVTTSPTFDFSGSVVLYATRLSGCLGALCVTLTPGNAVTLLLRLAGGVTGQLSLTLTRVTTDQPLVIAGALESGRLSLSVG
jgi:Family of unknown function (DUF6114)